MATVPPSSFGEEIGGWRIAPPLLLRPPCVQLLLEGMGMGIEEEGDHEDFNIASEEEG